MQNTSANKVIFQSDIMLLTLNSQEQVFYIETQMCMINTYTVSWTQRIAQNKTCYLSVSRILLNKLSVYI